MNSIINKNLIRARERDVSTKLFYSLIRDSKNKNGFIYDIGSTIEVEKSEKLALRRIIQSAHKESLFLDEYLNYSSSWGDINLRLAIKKFFIKRGVTDINEITEIMVTKGILDAFQKVLNCLDITHVIVPEYAPHFAETFSISKGKKVIIIPVDADKGTLDLKFLKKQLNKLNINKDKVLMYITHPGAPVGFVLNSKFIENNLIPFLAKEKIFLFSDSYITSTSFTKSKIKPILSFKNAKSVCVEAITLSKEIGLPGIRVGGIAGNEKVIEAMRIQAATEIDMIPLFAQRLATKALNSISPSLSGRRVQRELKKDILPVFKKMHWPVILPKAGFDMLVEIPPAFFKPGIKDPALFASFSILNHFGVAFFPYSVSHTRQKKKFFLRLVLKQKDRKISKALLKMHKNGFIWSKYKPKHKDMEFLKEKIKTLDLTKL